MNRFESITKPNITKPLMWLTALLLAAIVAGCGGTHDGVLPISSGGGGPGLAGASPVLTAFLPAPQQLLSRLIHLLREMLG